MLPFIGVPSCTPEPCLGFTASADFSSQEKESLRVGFRRYNDFVGVERFSLVPTQGCPIERHDYPLDDQGNPIHNGTYRKYNRTMWLGTDVVDDSGLQLLVMHELGHADGMNHLAEGQTGVMMANNMTIGYTLLPDGNYAYIRKATDWTWSDRSECERSDACSDHHLP